MTRRGGEDGGLAAVGGRERLDFAADDDEERHDFLAGLDEHVPARDRPSRAMRRDAIDLRGGQRGKETFVLWKGGGLGRGHRLILCAIVAGYPSGCAFKTVAFSSCHSSRIRSSARRCSRGPST